MDKFMYIIEFWSRYSEYGGVINVIAKDDEEVMSLLMEEFDGIDTEGLTMEWISNSDKFRLSESVDSRIVVSFTT